MLTYILNAYEAWIARGAARREQNFQLSVLLEVRGILLECGRPTTEVDRKIVANLLD